MPSVWRSYILLPTQRLIVTTICQNEMFKLYNTEGFIGNFPEAWGPHLIYIHIYIQFIIINAHNYNGWLDLYYIFLDSWVDNTCCLRSPALKTCSWSALNSPRNCYYLLSTIIVLSALKKRENDGPNLAELTTQLDREKSSETYNRRFPLSE